MLSFVGDDEEQNKPVEKKEIKEIIQEEMRLAGSI